MRFLLPTALALFAAVIGLDRLAGSEKSESPEQWTHPADDGWRRTVDGWEQLTAWQQFAPETDLYRPESRAPVVPAYIHTLNPIGFAVLQGIAALVALAYWEKRTAPLPLAATEASEGRSRRLLRRRSLSRELTNV